MHLNFFRSKSFGLDLGNNNTLVSDSNTILLDQPSYIVFDTINKAVKAVGEEAYKMFEKTHEDLRPVKPLKGGVIADYDSAYSMISEMVRKTGIRRNFYEGFDHIISGVPFTTTEVERRALNNALEQFSAKRTNLLYEPLAAALGMGLDIRKPDGKMIVDIGGGITEIVIISLSGIASFESLNVSGDTMDNDIRDYFRRQYNLGIGLKTAEQVKIMVGAACEDIVNPPAPLQVKGKDMITGIPVVKKIDHKEVSRILERSVLSIEQSIVQTLEKCPPELAADVYGNGIHLTGGNALLRGLGQTLQKRIGLSIIIDETPLLSVSKGIAEVLRNPQRYSSILLS